MKATKIDTKIIFAAAHIEARKGHKDLPYSYRFKIALGDLYFTAKWEAGAKEVCNPDFFAWLKGRYAGIIKAMQAAQIAANDQIDGSPSKFFVAHRTVKRIGKKLEQIIKKEVGLPIMYVSFLDVLASSRRPVAAYYL